MAYYIKGYIIGSGSEMMLIRSEVATRLALLAVSLARERERDKAKRKKDGCMDGKMRRDR